MDTTLKDFGGYEEAKLEIIEYVNFINHQDRYEQLGARLPKGALLNGPPGTGKTLLAKTTAGAANIPFIAVSSGSLLLGEDGPSKVRQIFQLAYSMAPCVLFFDEIDCTGRKRNDCESTPQSQSLTEEMLVQLDGFNKEDKLVIIMASTNFLSVLDDALTRPGRFDRIIKMTGGMSGAQIASVCNEAAMIAARDLNDEVRMDHFEKALDRVRSGIKRQRPLSAEERLRAAHHDAAHAIAGWYMPGAIPPTTLCILPNADGEIECSLGCDKMPIVDKTNGANLAECGSLGMISTKTTHLRWCEYLPPGILLDLKYRCGPAYLDKFFDETKKLLDKCYESAKKLLTEKKDELEKVTQLLLTKDLVTLDMLIEVLGPSPHADPEALSDGFFAGGNAIVE